MQRNCDIEYIIIDGGSNDGTIEIINKYKHKISSFISEPDKGIYNAMNKGIKAASGYLIAFLNSDDLYATEDVVADIVTFIKHYSLDAAYGDLVYVSRNNPEQVVRYWKTGKYKKGAFQWGWVMPHPTFFCKKSIFENYGYFNDDFRIAADFELMLRFVEKHNINIKYLPKVLVKMMSGGRANKLGGIIRGNWEIISSFRQNNIRLSVMFFLWKPITRIVQLFSRTSQLNNKNAATKRQVSHKILNGLKNVIVFNVKLTKAIDRQFHCVVEVQDSKNTILSLVKSTVNRLINERGFCSILEAGGIDRPLFKRSKNVRYDGLDIEHTKDCEQLYDRFFVQSIEELIPENYDLIISTSLLEHVKDNNASFSRIYESLKPGGYTIHYLPSKYHPYSLILRSVGPKWQKRLIKTLRPWAKGKTGYPTYFDKCSPKEMKELVKRQGFKSVTIVPFFRANDYFRFCLPFYIAVTLWENICRKLEWERFSSGFILITRK